MPLPKQDECRSQRPMVFLKRQDVQSGKTAHEDQKLYSMKLLAYTLKNNFQQGLPAS